MKELNTTSIKLLNDSDLSKIKGGYKPGDIIFENKHLTIKYCLTWEVHCENGFSFDDGKMNCGSGFTWKEVK